MSKLKRFCSRFKFQRTAKIVKLKTGVSSVLIPTTGRIKRIEVFNTIIAQPQGQKITPLRI